MSLLRSFCTPYGAPGRLYYDSYEFFKCGPQADLRAWRKLAVTFFAQQIQIENSLGWFLTLWTTHSCKNQLVANFFPDILHNSLTITLRSKVVKPVPSILTIYRDSKMPWIITQKAAISELCLMICCIKAVKQTQISKQLRNISNLKPELVCIINWSFFLMNVTKFR